MVRYLPILAAIPLTVAFGVADGLWTDRWQRDTAPLDAAARLASVPAGVGDWTSESDELDARQLSRAEAAGYLLRRYRSRRTGQELTVLIVCGRPGPISVHTPDVCYQGRGYSADGEPVLYPLQREDEPAAQLRTARFRKNGPSPEPLRIFWTWSAGQSWSAPASPRVEFARERALFKLYVVQPLGQLNEPIEQSPVPDFLRQLLPQLEQSLFAAR